MISTVIPTYSGIFLIPMYSYLIDVYVCVIPMQDVPVFQSWKLEFIIEVLPSRHFDWSVLFVLSVHLTDLLRGTSYWLTRKHVIKQTPWEFKHKVRPFCLSNQLALIVRISIVSIPHDHVMSASSIALDVYCTLESFPQALPCEFSNSYLGAWASKVSTSALSRLKLQSFIS